MSSRREREERILYENANLWAKATFKVKRFWLKASPNLKKAIIAGIGLSLFLFVALIWGLSTKKDKSAAVFHRFVFLRQDFETKVIGKTPEQVMNVIGRPERTEETSALFQWKYDEVTRETATKKIDKITTVTFERGVAVKVEFD